MGEEVDSVVIQQTQETLGKYIKKPPLSEKLLRKPPFKFLHDIVKAVINATGFMRDLFTEEELNSESVKDRDAKIAFLQKAIDGVASVTKEPLKIRPNKTVAGHEADRTNEFLQALAKAIDIYNSNSDAKNEVKQKSPSSKHSTKKSEIGSVNEEKSRKHIKNESPKAVSNSKSAETIKAGKPESKHRNRVEQNGKKKENGHTRSSDREPVKKSSKKDDGFKVEDSSLLRSKSKDRSHHRTRTKPGSKLEDNVSNERQERKEKENKEKTRGSRDPRENREKYSSGKTQRSSKENHIRVKETSKESGTLPGINENSPRRMKADKPEKRSAEARTEVLNGEVAGSHVVPVESLVLSSKENSPLSSPPRRPPTARNAMERPSTGRPQTSKMTNGDNGATVDEPKQEAVPKETVASVPDNTNSSHDRENIQRPLTSTIRRSSARPPTARPAAPRVKVVDIAPEEIPSQDSNNQVANIIIDGALKDDEGDDDDDGGDDRFDIGNSPPLFHETQLINGHSPDLQQEGNQHGSLVTQILETKKDLENGSQRPGSRVKLTEMDKSLLSDVSWKKERELFSREMEKLKSSVQMLTRSANPLGKLIDYLQEDLDSMLGELDTWYLERTKNENALRAEESKSDTEIEKLRHQLQETEDSIQDEIAKISNLKANIIRNEERIQKMIAATRL